MEGLADDNEGTPVLERLETGEEEGDARGLTRSALGPAVGEETHNVFKTKRFVCNLFPKVRHPARGQTEIR